MNKRVKKLVALFEQHSIDALLIKNKTNIRYLIDFPAEDSWLLVTRKKLYYITDFRYITAAKNAMKGVVIRQYEKSMALTLLGIAYSEGIKFLGYDEGKFSVLEYKNLKRHVSKSVKLVAANGLVESLRAIKDADEIKMMKKALKIHHQALNYLKKVIKPGLTEREVFEKLEHFVKSKGAGFSFPPIIAAGPNSCLPHAKITSRKICKNDAVLVDMGIDINGYKSDLTRMFFLGKIPQLIRDTNTYVSLAQKEAIKIIKPGISVAKVDQQARKCLEKNKLSEFFGHALGHGIGLDVHEIPRLSIKSKEVLREGMVVTVEPGVYFPNEFGIRIEDMILVTKKGCENLSDNYD